MTQIKLENYIYSWGAKGFSLLIQSLVSNALAKFPFFESFVVEKDDDLRVYRSIEATTKASEYGLEVLSSYEKAVEFSKSTNQEAQKVKESKNINELLSNVENFLHKYLVLDPEFTSLVIETKPELVEFLGIQKNDLREVLNNIIFAEESNFQKLLHKFIEEEKSTKEKVFGSTVEEICSKNIQGHADYFIHTKEGKVSYTYTQEFINELWREITQKRTELKGVSVAKKGIYAGKVKKLDFDYSNTFHKELERLNSQEKGFIFVADHTSPELVPIMKKSIAIITTMGGMLSHAAITSRELGIPCVVGVTGATDSLNDGDEIEVNANTGKITIK